MRITTMTTENKLDELKAKAADAKVQGEKALDDLKENVKEKQAAGKEAVEDKVDELKAKAVDAKAQGEKALEDLKKM